MKCLTIRFVFPGQAYDLLRDKANPAELHERWG